MNQVPVGLDDLITLVHELHPEGDELVHLTDAGLVSERLGELGDHLLGHFVDLARQAGAPWSAIGASMGVSKQAVQHRFVPGPDDGPGEGVLSRFTPRAHNSLEAARAEASGLGAEQVGTHHLLLGLLTEAQGVAARALDGLGVTIDRVRTRIGGDGKPEPTPGRIPFSPQTKKVLTVAVREALLRRHNYIGTEHLLLGVIADESSEGTKLLSTLGVTSSMVTTAVDEAIAALTEGKKSGQEKSG